MITGVLGLIFDITGEKILLIKRRDIPIWVLPGGKIEPNENANKAVLREVFEETGFHVRIKRKIAEYKNLKSDKIDSLYICEVISGKPTTGPETKDIGFFYIDHLPNPYNPYLPGWLKNIPKNHHRITKEELKPFSKWVILMLSLKYPIAAIRYFLTKIGIKINT